jgi:hypothetical protein
LPLDTGCLDQARPAIRLFRDELAEFLRRAAADLVARPHDLLADLLL